MFKHTIAYTPARSLVDDPTPSHLGKPNYARALEQYNAYTRALQTCDVDIILLPPDERSFNPVFVEDPVFCASRCVTITHPGAKSRRGETEIIEETVQRFYPGEVKRIETPDTVEAGNIMMVGDHFYIDESARINTEGARQMIAILGKHGLNGSMVCLEEVLHPKTRLACLKHNNLLVAGELIGKSESQDFNIIEIPEEESYATNCIWVSERVIMPASYPWIYEKIARLSYRVIGVDTFEYRKINGGVSCMLLCF